MNWDGLCPNLFILGKKNCENFDRIESVFSYIYSICDIIRNLGLDCRIEFNYKKKFFKI